MDASETSNAYTFISEDVISKVRSELVLNGELYDEDSVLLSEIQAIWKKKMIQAGVINGTIERSPAEGGVDIDAQLPRTNPSTDLVTSIKNERDGFNIPQHDGGSAEPNTYAPYDEDDEVLNEDDDEEDAFDDDEEVPHLVMCQFDNVKKRKNKWECKLRAGVMQINGKNIIFAEAKGDFVF